MRSRFAGWADFGNHHRRQGVGTWLVGHDAQWLRVGQVQRVLASSCPEQHDGLGFLTAIGSREMTRTERGWRVHANRLTHPADGRRARAVTASGHVETAADL